MATLHHNNVSKVSENNLVDNPKYFWSYFELRTDIICNSTQKTKSCCIGLNIYKWRLQTKVSCSSEGKDMINERKMRVHYAQHKFLTYCLKEFKRHPKCLKWVNCGNALFLIQHVLTHRFIVHFGVLFSFYFLADNHEICQIFIEL